MGGLSLSLLRLIACCYAIQPWWLRRFEGKLLGGLLRVTGFRSAVIRRNLELAYPGSAPDVVRLRKKMLARAYSHFGNLVLDLTLVLGPFRWFTLRNASMIGLEHFWEARQKGKGVIFLASHVGNWEIMAAIGGLQGMDPLLVTKHLKPEWLHQAFEKGRSTCEVRGTYEPKTWRDIMRQLKENKTVGIVLDQYAGPPIGVRVPFFGIPVGTSSALAMLARRTGAPVLPVVSYQNADGKWIVDVRPPLKWIEAETKELEVAWNTAEYTRIIENDIRRHPEQWLWTHRRFKGDLSDLKDGEWTEGRLR